jgi:uncharacterized protein (DUF885 family)
MPEARQHIETFVGDFHRHFTRDPNQRVNLGVEGQLGELVDPSRGAIERRLSEARALIGRAEALATESLDFDTRLDVELATLKLRAELHNDSYVFNDSDRLAQTPLAGDDIGDGIFGLMINDPREPGARIEDVRRRIAQVPDYLDALLGRLERPVDRWVAMDAEKVAGLPQLFDTVRNWADEHGYADRSGLSSAIDEAARALSDYREKLLALDTVSNVHVGERTARRIVELRGIEASLEQLRDVARDFLADNAAQTEALRRRLIERHGLDADTDAASLQAHLNQRFRVLPDVDRGAIDFDQVLARYRQERESVLAFIRERELFPVFDEQDMKILQTPGFMTPSIPAGAMLPPPAFRDGVRTSLIYLTLSPELLDEHTELSIPVMMIHEGIPGHHLQLAWASRHSSVVRRHVEAMDQAEGWTTMLEDYMLDAGYAADLADEARFSAKRDIARLGARVAIDLFFMTGDKGYLEVGVDADLSSDDPFEAAGQLLKTVTGFTDARLHAELNWYSQERGYPLSYLAGNRAVNDLKRDMTAAKRFSGRPQLDVDRAFHRAYLEAGNMPVAYLRRVFAEQGLIDA